MFILADGESAFSCGKTDELRYEELTRIFKELEAAEKPVKGRIRDRIADTLNKRRYKGTLFQFVMPYSLKYDIILLKKL